MTTAETPPAAAPDPLRAALERIAGLAPAPFKDRRDRETLRCSWCNGEWYPTSRPEHEEPCAYLIARAALAAQPGE